MTKPFSRLRYAPSPTGGLHLGNARTAVFNHLLAAHLGGTLVLRIDDTDEARSRPELIEATIDILRWLGIEWQEGPDKGGDYGPYKQSERLHLYTQAVDGMLESGAAYRCFCSEERLLNLRETALRLKRPPRYDGRCRAISREESQERAATGIPHTVRFKMPESGEIVFPDLVKGERRIQFDNLGGDFIVMRSGGIATYNLACVIDDAMMKIDLVLRGEDHLTNTALQIKLYEALGHTPPQFAHVPIVLGPDRSKLSKRHGAVTLQEFRRLGYLPEALLNELALIGWSPKDGREEFSREELIAAFGTEGLSRSLSVFDPVKLDWFNQRRLRALDNDDYLRRSREFISAELVALAPAGLDLDAALLLIKEELVRFGDLEEKLLPIVGGEPDAEAREVLIAPDARPVLQALASELATLVTLDAEAWDGLLTRLKDLKLAKGKRLFMPLRAALTGRVHGPELARLVPILGLAEVKRRVAGILNMFNPL